VIRSFLRVSFVALVACVFAACSSKESPADGGDAGISGGGAGGKSGGQAGKGTGGDGQTGPACTTADAGSDACQACLAKSCCSDFTDCQNDALCTRSLQEHLACFRTPGEEASFCFGNFTRALQGDAGQAAGLKPIPICIIMHCSMVCGGPGVV
jgi:hypothetical protein